MQWTEYSEWALRAKTTKAVELQQSIKQSNLSGIRDIITSDTEIVVIHELENPANLIQQLSSLASVHIKTRPLFFEIPVCYDLGLDWSSVEQFTGLSKNQVIEIHQKTVYTTSYGFAPGFLYLDGLPEEIHCPRRTSPRPDVPPGSVGIGGQKTGIYALSTPGGWQIIGRTPERLFDPSSTDPIRIPPQARIRFKSISKEAFNENT